jgi:hypothetical protein
VLTAQTSGYRARDRQRLLTEAAVWQAGADGLSTVARRPGDHQPTAYLDWIDALARESRLDDAVAAAREAMTLVGLPAERKAEVADRLGEPTARLGDQPAALDARRAAWRADRTRTRLLALVAAAEAAGQRTATLQAEADLVPAAADRLGCALLLLLAGRIDDAVVALVALDPLGWSLPEHPGPVVWPVLLVAAIVPAVPDAQTHLGRQFAAVDTAGHRYGWTTRDPDDGDGAAAAPPSLSSLLTSGIASDAGSQRQRRQWLAAAREVADRRIDAVVGGKHRGAYQRVAVAYAEALALAEDHAAGRTRRGRTRPLSPARGLPRRARPSDSRVCAAARTPAAPSMTFP